MLKPIEINFKLDKTIKRAHSTELMIKSHDINVIEFHISFDGLELTADHTVKVLSVFSDTGSQTNVNCEIADGKAIYRPDTSIISQYDYVRNYVYVYHGDQSLDAHLFTYSVDSSKIDKTTIKVKTVYDQSYTELLTEFEARLQDYKDGLPQASDLRAEVDVILNKFKVDSENAIGYLGEVSTSVENAEASRVENEYERVQAETERKEAETLRVESYEQLIDTAIIEADVVEKVDNKVTELTPQINSLTAQLEQTLKQESYNAMTYHAGNSFAPKAYVTFVDDDGSVDVLTRLKPLFVEKGVPCVVAATGNPVALPSIGPTMTFSQMKDLQDTHGWEIASHSVNHHSFINIDADKESVRFEARESKRILESHGLNISNIVYPFNSATDFSRDVCSQYYDSGVTGGNGVNTQPVDSYGIRRIALGSHYGAGQGTYEYYKSRVDEAISKNGWAVFMLHIWNPAHDETQQQHLSDVIDYCLANNVGIVTIREGLKTFGNKFQIAGKLSITNQGKIIDHNPEPVYKIKRDESILHNSPITAFEKGTITHTTINGGKQQSLPAYGALVTFRTHDLDDNFSYQTLYGSNPSYHRIYHRRWLNGAWGTFKDLVPKGVTVTVPDIVVGVVNAGKTKTVSVPVGINLAGKPFTLNINMGLDEIIYSYVASGPSVRVTFYNTHTAPLDVGTKTAIVHLPTQET